MLTRWMTTLLLGIGVFAGAAVAQQQGVTDTEILLGETLPLTGPPALLGTAISIGTRLAVIEANAAGGVNGRKLRQIVEDDGYVPSRAVQAVRKLIDVDKVFALTAISGSGASLAALPTIVKAGIPTMASVTAIAGLYQPPRQSVFVAGQSYEEGIYQLARHLATKFPGKKWGIVTQDDEYGQAFRTGFGRARKEFNLNVTFEAEYKRGQQDFSSEMLRARAAGIEIFMCGGVVTENIAMMKELEKLNVKPVVAIPWVGRIAMTLKLVGPASDGIYSVDYVDADDSPSVTAFNERAKKLFTEAEFNAMNRLTLVNYASTKILIEAMRRCGRNLTWACTIAELEKTKVANPEVMGAVTFGPDTRFSSQEVRIMRADYGTLSYKRVP